MMCRGDFRPLASRPGYAVRVKRLGWIALLAGCGFQGTAPSGPSDGSNTPIIDAAVPDDTAITLPPIDGRVCFGNGLLKNLCLMVPPAGDRTLSTAINTDGPTTCTQVLMQTGSPTMAPELCVIAARTITVQGTVTVQGARALVLIGAETVTVAASSVLDASSTTADPPRIGAGANPGACSKAGIGDSSANGAGGGAGGSLATQGGKGGRGNLNAGGGPQNASQGGNPGATQPSPTVLRGGCSGGKGGDGQNNNGGTGGNGGGAVYLLAGTSIAIVGDVFASGAGGDGTPNNAGRQQGGGGGGSGGLIGLEAPTITVDGRVVANGAAGAGGGATTGGKPGSEGTTTSWNMRATPGGPGTDCSGAALASGAQGTAINAADKLDGGESACGGGGGGGGLGIVTTYGALSGGTTISPAATKHP